MPPCPSGKIQHPTRIDAVEHQKSLVYANHVARTPERSKGLNVYPCDMCNSWHVGHADTGPAVYHYTPMTYLDAILDSGVLRALPPRVFTKKSLRGLPRETQRQLKLIEEPAPLLWFSRNPEWDYSVIKSLRRRNKNGNHVGREVLINRRSDLEVAGGGLLRFVVPAWCAKLRWSDYLARNPTPPFARDEMARHGDPVEWLCTDEDVPLTRVRDIQVYYRSVWTPVADVSDDDFGVYIAGRPAEYAAAMQSLNVKMDVVVATGQEEEVSLTEPEQVLFQDFLHECGERLPD
jgi:hypothetical protein